tara:strand:+ start:1197 stop:1946 length:750 start_codon:yes stop_codon:yes gene_type:complete
MKSTESGRSIGVLTLGFDEVKISDERLKSALDIINKVFSQTNSEVLDFREVDSQYNFKSAFWKSNAGSCIELAKQCYIKEGKINDEIFYEYYNNNTDRDKISIAFNKALVVAESHFTNSSKDFIKESLVAHFYKRLISETVVGFKKEMDVAELIKNTYGLDVKHTPVEIDSRYAVDLETSKFSVQVKPHTYKSNSKNNPQLQKDKESNLKLHKEYRDKFGLDVVFVYYNKTTGSIDLSEIKNLKLKVSK